MTTYSSHLRLTKQAVGENPDTWGTVLNDGVFEMLEDSICGLAQFSVSGGDVTLTTVNGAADQARCMIIQVTGSPGVARNVIVPALSKVYLCNNKTSGGFTITIKTSAGSGVALPANKPTWVYCDGTNVLAADNSSTTTDAVNVTTTINGVAIANYARKDVTNAWTQSQYTTTTVLSAGATINVNLNTSNKFRVVLNVASGTLANPTNPHDGQNWEVLAVQDGTGSRTLAYGSKYRFPGGVTPTLTTTANRADILTFSYDSVSDKHIGSIIQNITLT